MKKPVDKDQLIEKPEINTVGVITNHQFNWYICSNDMWTMDIDKYIQAYQEAGLDIDFSYLPEIQQNLHVITKSNLESYLEMYKDDWLKVTVEELIEMIKRSMDCEDLHSEIIFEGKGLLPNLLIDFVVPNARDLAVGKHLFIEDQSFWKQQGVTTVTVEKPSAAHIRYLEQLGFTRAGGSDVWSKPV